MCGINNNQPQVLDELVLNTAPIYSGSLFATPTVTHLEARMGSCLQSHIERVCDKLVLCAHAKALGRRASDNCLVMHFWYTNRDISMGRLASIPQVFGPLQLIRQGKKTSKGQFAYQVAASVPEIALFRFVFQNSMVLVSTIINDIDAAKSSLLSTQLDDFRRPMTSKPKPPSIISLAPSRRIIQPITMKRGTNLG